MVDLQKQSGLDQLGINQGRRYRHDRLIGIHDSSFRHGVNIPPEFKMQQIIQKFFRKQIFRPQIINIFLAEMKVLDILHHLL